MDYTSKSETRRIPRSPKEQLIEFLQLIFVLLLFGGMVWAVINIQHYDGYYTDGTL
jgi:flagellar biogenesis protein FliO